ncbi:hypothetical protein KM043_017563 [Ampulex compressa]|nr:hypothetical protein KM043_017563 [Ampulex compressa]
MPMLRKKSNKNVMMKKIDGKSENFVGDITIDDFANTSRSHARFKKAVMNVSSEVKQVMITQEGTLKIHDDLEEMAEAKKNTAKGHVRTKKSQLVMTCEDKKQEGVDYPLDVWFIISEYISPEAVGKFARICRSSYHVTTTGKFWFYLYKTRLNYFNHSYYRFVPDLPERLQPQCMANRTSFSCEKTMLSYVAQERQSAVVFLFQTQRDIKEDVAVNPEDGCKILRVTCLKYSMLPPVIGLILQTVSMNLMPGFKDHRLQLSFGTSGIPNTSTSQVVLNDVIDYQVLDWWHPYYPHQDAVSIIELPQTDSWD